VLVKKKLLFIIHLTVVPEEHVTPTTTQHYTRASNFSKFKVV